MRRVLLWAGIACGACSGDTDPAKDQDGAPSDADADTDTDADADTDTDADTDPLPTSFEAQIVYEETLDASPYCSTVIDLVGSVYTGTCPGCSFAFDVDASVAATTGTNCELPPQLTWVEDDRFSSLRIAFSPTFTDYVPIARTYTNVLWFSGYFDAGYYYYGGDTGLVGPVFYMVANDENPYQGKATFDGSTLDWALTDASDFFYVYTPYLDYCGYTQYTPYGVGPFPGADASDELACDRPYLDVWEFDADMGDPIRLSVDLLDPLEAFRPIVHVTDDTGCIVTASYGTFQCSVSGGYYYYMSCPAVDIVAPATGTYRAVVSTGGYSLCPADGAGVYDLALDSPAGPIVQIADEELRYDGPYEYELNVEMIGIVGD